MQRLLMHFWGGALGTQYDGFTASLVILTSFLGKIPVLLVVSCYISSVFVTRL
jgi:hypothetical protein